MSRHKNFRKVTGTPTIKGFKVWGLAEGQAEKEAVFLHIEEHEALRLCDYESLNHEEACVLMHVSRPTFTRIYSSARRKIATALAEGRNLVIEGGKVYFDSGWYLCPECDCYFNHTGPNAKPESCPLCGGIKISAFAADIQSVEKQLSYNYRCHCRKCGYEHFHQRHEPCSIMSCPDCFEMLSQTHSIED